MKKVIFIKNALILTATALLLRLAGIIFKVWLASAVGSEGIGLYQLVVSVYIFISSFASGGICTAVTRLCSESLAQNAGGEARAVLKRGIALSLLLSAATLFICLFFKSAIAMHVVGDARAEGSIAIIGFSIPFIAVSSCIRGYFFSRRKSIGSCLSQLIEQAVRITLVLALAGAFATKGLSFAVAAVVLGDCAAEIVSCIFLYISLRLDMKNLNKNRGSRKGYREIIRISAPLTASRYLNSGLRTGENMLTVRALGAFSSEGALSQFGMLKGMALPLLFFPSSLLQSVSLLLIPEMSEAQVKNENYKIKYAVEKVMKLCFCCSFFLSVLFFTLAGPLGRLIYGSEEISFLLRALSPLIPFMYIDSICDGMLKGLDKQKLCSFLMVSDSAARLLFIPFIVSRFGLLGFLGIMVVSNLYTSVFRVAALLKAARLRFKILQWGILPLIISLFSVSAAFLFSASVGNDLLLVIAVTALSLAFYLPLCFFFKVLSKDDFKL